MSSLKETALPVFTLFTSFGTLICCALPALLVSIGAGAALAGAVSAVPQLVWFSEHKTIVFTLAGIMIVIAGGVGYLKRNEPCPTDPVQAIACKRLKKISNVIYGASVVIFFIGFYFAYLAKYFL